MCNRHFANLIRKKTDCDLALAEILYAHRLGETFYGAYVYVTVGAGYEIMGQLDSAYKYTLKGYRIGEKIGSKSALASALLVLGGIYNQRGDLAASEKAYLKALDITYSIGFTAQIPELANRLKKLYVKQKDYKKAFAAYELHIQARDSISNERSRRLALQEEFDYNVEKKEHEKMLLEQQYQIQRLELNQTKYGLAGLGVLVFLLLTAG